MILLLLIMFFNFFNNQEPEYIKLSNQLTNDFSKNIQKNTQLKRIGSGGSLNKNVKKVSLDFLSDQCATISESRKTIIKLNEELIYYFNNFESIRPFLDNYPFEPKNIKVTLYYPKKTCQSSESLVSSAGPIDDEIVYFLYSPITCETLKEYRESYNDAYKIVYGHDRPK